MEARQNSAEMRKIMKIWCVEDDAGIRDIEVYTLNSMDFEAKGFPDAAAFREALAKDKPDLVILDIMLPGEDGVAILKSLKDSTDTCMIPVIMATAKGIGISPEHQTRIFERFYRVDKSRSKESGGTGLGLSIVKHAVQYMNGKIDLQSSPGEGTTIRISFGAGIGQSDA